MAIISNYNEWANTVSKGYKHEFINSFLTESKLTVSLSKEQFISQVSNTLFESEDDLQKDIHYALFEAYVFYSSNSEWFTSNNKPTIVRTSKNTVFFSNNKCFSITNESFDILQNIDLNENIFSDAWSSVSNFFSNAWDGIKQVGDQVGSWVKEVSDSAKAVAGFAKIGYMAVSVLQSNDWKSIASTLVNISQTLASTYATSLNLDQTKLAATASISSGLINLYDGREMFLKGWEQLMNSKPTDNATFGKGLIESTPDTFLGISKMCMGIKDISISIKPDLKFENITNVEEFSSDDTSSKLKDFSNSLTKEGEGEGLAKSVLAIKGTGNFDANTLKDSWKSLAICEIAFGVENVYPTNKKEILDGLSKAKEYVPKAKDFPTIIQNWISTAEKTEFTGGEAIIKDVIQTMGKPMIEAAKNFTTAVLPDLLNTAEWMGEVSVDYDKANKEIVQNCKPTKVSFTVVALPEVKPSKEDTKISNDDLAVLNKNLPSLAKEFNIASTGNSGENKPANENHSTVISNRQTNNSKNVMSFSNWLNKN